MTCRQTINQLRPEQTAGEILPFLPKGKEIRESKVERSQENLKRFMLSTSTGARRFEIVQQMEDEK